MSRKHERQTNTRRPISYRKVGGGRGWLMGSMGVGLMGLFKSMSENEVFVEWGVHCFSSMVGEGEAGVVKGWCGYGACVGQV